MSSFRAAIRAFKNTESTAQGMIDTIYNVLDRDNHATIGLVKEIGQIFEVDGEKDKARNVLEAINGFKAQVSLSKHQITTIRLIRCSKSNNSLRWSDQVG